jgi:hypothetical protein
MSLHDIIRRIFFVNKSLDFLDKKTDDLTGEYESVEDCYEDDCEEEKVRIRAEMKSCINKIKMEERELNKAEETFQDTYSGQMIL